MLSSSPPRTSTGDTAKDAKKTDDCKDVEAAKATKVSLQRAETLIRETSLSFRPTSFLRQVSDSAAIVRRQPSGFRSRKLTIETKINQMLACQHEEGRLVQLPHPATEICSPGTVASVWGGLNDEQDHFQAFFTGKAMHFDNCQQLGACSHSVGVHCQRGQKPQHPNQDDFFVLQKGHWLLFGVADGHGQDGHKVSHCVQEKLPQFLLKGCSSKSKPWRQCSEKAFAEMNNHLKQHLPQESFISGCTASVVWLAPDADGALRLSTAYVGDSSIVYAKKVPSNDSWEISLLTPGHRPDQEDEANRILSRGGQIIPSPDGTLPARLHTPSGNIAMSRSLGDLDAHPFGLISVPDCKDDIILEDNAEHMILVCSDGIWDVLDPREVVNIVSKFASDDCQRAAERLAQKAQSRWQQKESQPGVIDDITAIVVRPFWQFSNTSGSFLRRETC